MTKKLRVELTPFLGKEVTKQMHAEREKPSPTLAELMDEFEEKGKSEATREFAQELIRENFSDAYIAKLTKLKLDEVMELRKSMQS